MASIQAAAKGQAAAVATAATHPYTCNTCQVAYRNIDLQKTHMKSDWHRYNLKRRIASLPPIAAETFTEKVLQARAETTAQADKAYFERSCDACNKTYYSENAFRNHLLSQKHKQNLLSSPKRVDDETTSVISSTFSLGEPAPAPNKEVDSDAEDEFNQVIESLQNAKVAEQRPSPVKRPNNPHPDPIKGEEPEAEESASVADASAGPKPAWTLNSCLFCNYESPTAALNAHHMERFHGMFIPEKTYLVNLKGLIQHLQRKVAQDHQCLCCGKFKANVYAVQTHMKDKGHCKIPFTTEEEQLDIGDFYDFRSTYSDDEEDEESDSEATEDGIAGGAKLGARREVKATDAEGQELEEGEDAEGWETDSSASSLDSEYLTAVPAEGHIHQFERLSKHPHHTRTDPRHHHQPDGWHSRAHKHTHAAFHDEYELHLPNGKSVGHRSLNKYFRQNLHNYPTPEERAERLAIEAAEQEENGANDQSQAVPRGRGREVIPRGALGMSGVTDDKRRELRKTEGRAQDLQLYRTKKTDWSYSKKMNNQKNYYYRYDGGG
ncbi:Cytoplasmic 60S subunit biogenesis factor REI1 -like protein [Escovopsis weberi]|uniref:Cytoplasmic 60S subunit biogenesis factor REI1-like protein n=1 Tax=Escovopsis weberi TaxID=150374 RepID=A0A0M9VWG4_ESCWE|nr:Cytoplasmic 60S subunit biogenesis factor REI1 -like protein [Escovopsis weberi]